MGFFDIFKRSASPSAEKRILKVSWSQNCIQIIFSDVLTSPSVDGLLEAIQDAGPEDSVLGAYLAQLVTAGYVELDTTEARLSWDNFFQLQGLEEHAETITLFNLPSAKQLQPVLDCNATVSDRTFQIYIASWIDGRQSIQPTRFVGPIVFLGDSGYMLPAAAWHLLSALAAFADIPESERTQAVNELGWGKIRQLAEKAGALYASQYLKTTIVLTPESLRLPVSKEESPFGRVLTVAPTFEGAPDGWLTAFDGHNSVQPHYDFSRNTGRTRVVISEPVRQVLNVIKREMPGRRVAGDRAEKFIHNPFAFLGDSARTVLREEEFERDRAEAGAFGTVFSIVGRIDQGRVSAVELAITEHFADGKVSADCKKFNDVEHFELFLSVLQKALEQDRMRVSWDEYDLIIDGESTVQFEQGTQLAYLWRTQPAQRICFDDVYELEGYSDRIEGIGTAKPIYVPVFQKDDQSDESKWLPSDLTPMVKVTLQGQEGQILLPLTHSWVDEFEQQIREAESSGSAQIKNASLPTPLATTQARSLVESFKRMIEAQESIKGERPSEKKERKRRETLLVKTNFHDVDYVEERKTTLALPEDWSPVLPRALRPTISLKKHQLYGVAWFQHLVSKSPTECRGALLADDMGLGKTLQLLSVLAWYYELNPNAAPSIIFAPKSLLENWRNESRKFFNESFPEVLVLFDEELAARKQPLTLIDAELRDNGIAQLLKPGWAGNAKIIVTTYEVLTSYEFSLAKQPFAFLICDEAQRIKTPGALVTLAAKKLKADFRIACTGTPVENTLADLWCLFDLVQPGLLGALEQFGRIYRRPIECETEEQKHALEKLQKLISPQMLRRTKADIAADLPKKYFAYQPIGQARLDFKPALDIQDRLEILMSEHQRVLYKGGLKKLQDAADVTDGRTRAKLSFGALHLMKAVCAEPYCLPGSKFLVDQSGSRTHLENSPKLKWLLERLELVKAAEEKAIVFTELREVQTALYYFLKDKFRIRPHIINGDSQGRQGYIDKFSEVAGFNVIILSTLAAGAGLNVTAANHVFHFTRAWNPSKEAQATDRAFRIGQERDVFVYCPTIVADDFCTFEVRLDELLKRKANLAGVTLEDNGITAMLNGSGKEASFKELIGDTKGGVDLPLRYFTMNDVDRLDGEGFEIFCCLLWRKNGFEANVTEKRRGDGGIDVVAIKGQAGELLQCKSSKSAEIGWDAVKEVTAGAAQYQARFKGIKFRRVAVTNQHFSQSAIEQAEVNRVTLVTRPQIEEMLARQPITNHEFDDVLFEAAKG